MFYLIVNLFSGLIGSMFSILQFFAAPLTGAASDYFGRRPVMLLTLVCLMEIENVQKISLNDTFLNLVSSEHLEHQFSSTPPNMPSRQEL